jgi:hypothetical protein
MTSLFSILFKNIILLILITISLVFIFTKNIGFNEVRYLFLGVGTLYVFAACLEAYKISSIQKETPKFVYFTDGFIAKRFIKIIVFICCGVVLYYSDSIIKYMAFLCFLIAFTEVIVTLWRYVKHLCYVALEGDLLIISTNKLNTMRASEIAKIEARHGLTYFVNYKNKTITMRTDMMKEKDTFKIALDAWILANHLSDKVIIE